MKPLMHPVALFNIWYNMDIIAKEVKTGKYIKCKYKQIDLTTHGIDGDNGVAVYYYPTPHSFNITTIIVDFNSMMVVNKHNEPPEDITAELIHYIKHKDYYPDNALPITYIDMKFNPKDC